MSHIVISNMVVTSKHFESTRGNFTLYCEVPMGLDREVNLLLKNGKSQKKSK